MRSKLRQFYVDQPLQPNTTVALPRALSQRLSKVLRLKQGDMIGLFNGQDGLWRATLTDAKASEVTLDKQLIYQPEAGGATLLIGLPKKEAMHLVLRQATELGIARVVPLILEFSVPTRFNLERAQAIVVEASEQCERLTLPEITPPETLTEAVTAYDTIYWAREDAPSNASLPNKPNKNAALLIGPEGGFSPAEKSLLSGQKHVHAFTLGENILRTDTAVVAALAKVVC